MYLPSAVVVFLTAQRKVDLVKHRVWMPTAAQVLLMKISITIVCMCVLDSVHTPCTMSQSHDDRSQCAQIGLLMNEVINEMGY